MVVDGEVDSLRPGDLIFLGAGVDHQLTSIATAEDDGRQKVSTLLLCGYCEFEQDGINPLYQLFPRMQIIRSEELNRHPWLKGTLDQLGTEYLSQNPGSELVVNKLTEIVLVELVRINFGQATQNPFLLALDDKALSKALQLIHQSPEMSWTLELLAKEVDFVLPAQS